MEILRALSSSFLVWILIFQNYNSLNKSSGYMLMMLLVDWPFISNIQIFFASITQLEILKEDVTLLLLYLHLRYWLREKKDLFLGWFNDLCDWQPILHMNYWIIIIKGSLQKLFVQIGKFYRLVLCIVPFLWINSVDVVFQTLWGLFLDVSTLTVVRWLLPLFQ